MRGAVAFIALIAPDASIETTPSLIASRVAALVRAARRRASAMRALSRMVAAWPAKTASRSRSRPLRTPPDGSRSTQIAPRTRPPSRSGATIATPSWVVVRRSRESARSLCAGAEELGLAAGGRRLGDRPGPGPVAGGVDRVAAASAVGQPAHRAVGAGQLAGEAGDLLGQGGVVADRGEPPGQLEQAADALALDHDRVDRGDEPLLGEGQLAQRGAEGVLDRAQGAGAAGVGVVEGEVAEPAGGVLDAEPLLLELAEQLDQLELGDPVGGAAAVAAERVADPLEVAEAADRAEQLLGTGQVRRRQLDRPAQALGGVAAEQAEAEVGLGQVAAEVVIVEDVDRAAERGGGAVGVAAAPGDLGAGQLDRADRAGVGGRGLIGEAARALEVAAGGRELGAGGEGQGGLVGVAGRGAGAGGLGVDRVGDGRGRRGPGRPRPG